MPAMETAVTELKKAFPGVRIMVGGAPVSQDFAERIGADAYAPDAASAAASALKLIQR
jgi:methanogenic corrinoid protein MtbC1